MRTISIQIFIPIGMACLMSEIGSTQGFVGKHVTISTRAAGEYTAPGNTQGPAPGDIAMQILLQDNGISARVVPDQLFYDVLGDFGSTPAPARNIRSTWPYSRAAADRAMFPMSHRCSSKESPS